MPPYTALDHDQDTGRTAKEAAQPGGDNGGCGRRGMSAARRCSQELKAYPSS